MKGSLAVPCTSCDLGDQQTECWLKRKTDQRREGGVFVLHVNHSSRCRSPLQPSCPSPTALRIRRHLPKRTCHAHASDLGASFHCTGLPQFPALLHLGQAFELGPRNRHPNPRGDFPENCPQTSRYWHTCTTPARSGRQTPTFP